MKKITQYFAALFLTLVAIACQKEGIEPLSGKYAEASQVSGQTLTNGGVTEEDGYYIFNITSADLNLNIVSRSWYPTAGPYTVGSELGNGILLNTSAVGGKTLDHGSITVHKDGDDYSIDGTLWLADESIVQIKGDGVLHYEEVIVEAKYYYELVPADNGYTLNLTDLSNNFAATFQFVTSSKLTGTYTVNADTDNLKDGDAVIGYDLSFFIPGLIGGCYFDVNGARWFIQAGTITVSGDESMYSVDVTGMTAINAASETYPEDHITFSNAAKAATKPAVTLTYDGWSCTYKAADNADAGTTEHTLSLLNAEGKTAGQVVVTTNLLDGVTGRFEPSDDTNKIGRYTPGMDLSAFGLGIIGTYVNVEGANQFITGGTLIITSAGGKLSVSVDNLVSGLPNVNGLSFPDMAIVQPEDPDDPNPGEDSFSVGGGSYTYTVAAKEGVDGIDEHTFLFNDAEGNLIGSFVCWTATGVAAPGFYSYAAATETAIGSFAGGFDFFGMATLGSYFVKDGNTYLVNAGTAILAEEDGKMSLLISDLSAATASGEASGVSTLYFSGMIDAATPPTFSVEGGSYTYTVVAKEGVDGVDEHTYLFNDAEGNLLGSFVCWTATGAEPSGIYSWSAATETAIGSFAGGLDFFGIATLGSYFVKDGNTYLINAGNALLTDADGNLALLITDLSAATAAGDASDVKVLAFSGMTKAE